MKKIFDDVFKELGYENATKIIKGNNTDYQCDDLFKLAKAYHKSPSQIGDEVIGKINDLDNFGDYFKEVTFSNPGFINITVSDKYICDKLRELMSKEVLGATVQNKKIVLDYGGPNVAKPLHVGHLRSAIIGQAINNILKFTGNDTIADVHFGDFGLQMGQVIYGILQDFDDLESVNIDLYYLNKTYPKISALCKEDDDVKDKCLKITKALQDGDETYTKLWKKIYDISVKDIKLVYDYLSVDFDLWLGESDSFKDFDKLFEIFENENILKEDDGAKIIDVRKDDDKKEIPPCLVQKSDGAYLYATSDLATIYQRERDYKPDNIIYITDNRQDLHFTQVFRAARKSKIYDGVLEHYGVGTVNGKDNKPFKTRTGGTMKLQDLITEVKSEFINLREENKDMSDEDIDIIVNAIIKFADLQNDLERNYIFDIKKFSEVNGKTGPYILYTYLRINKLINNNDGPLSDVIYSVTDRNLRLKLLEVSEVINEAAFQRKPHFVANYLYDLCTVANNFYQNNRVTDLAGTQKDDFEILLNYNNKVIRLLLGLLGIGVPTKM